ncbi:tetratricopeptide repeat protein [Sporolactobacillus kofuensis]|uniref:Tetratricopeptide repeat protein n=1 Tax=Sporolactobacillus kofuensis TaxID=269672 RepID=A0ABW1WD18_9BACL|nr:tetratricopeptide repeat protein [Sporolactobacillus kofuensis]MCO7175512.1 tetratricopeptide repeat protein [Sporolactobacillus kofuensis]
MKNNGKTNRDNSKLVMFPHLDERLLAKAMELVEEKNYNQARDLFGEMLEIDEHDIRGLYGWSVCSVELGDYRAAEESVVLLLEEDTPYYYDVFRLYLTILIERKDYKSALQEIMKANKKHNVPLELKDFFLQMQKFCRIRLHEPEWNQSIGEDVGALPNKQQREQGAEQSLDWPALEKADSNTQMLLLHNLTGQLKTKHLPEIERFLMDEHQQPEIKTMLLCAVKEGKLASEISMKKFGAVYHVQLDSEDFLNKRFADQIEEEIRRKLDSDNPTLADLAVDMERFFTMNVYPKPFVPASVPLWAAVFSIRAMGGSSADEIKLLSRFGVEEEEYHSAVSMVQDVESYGIWSS